MPSHERPPQPPRRPREARTRGARAVASVAVAAVLAGACGATTRADGAAPSPSTGRRIAEIRSARAVVEAPVLALAQTATATAAAVTRLRTEPPPTPGGAVRESDRIDGTDRPALRAALAQVEGLRLGGGADVAAAQDALDEAVAAGYALDDLAARHTDHARRLADADRRLLELVAGWSTPGSFGTQLERLDASRAAAETLRADLAAVTPSPPCSSALQQRIDAAAAVARASAELRGLVASRRGEAFDARVAALSEDPSVPRPDRPLPGVEAGCWTTSDLVAAEGRLRAAVEAVERALDPSELRTGG